MKRANRGTVGVMLALVLGILVGAGILTGLVLDWIRHPDF
jgi:hypothetical protein